MKILIVVFALISVISADDYGHSHVKYDYGYKVNGGHKGGHFGHHESKHGHGTQGQYHVKLPDGRLQTVTYHVDKGYKGGFVADVKYSGGHHGHHHHGKHHHHGHHHHGHHDHGHHHGHDDHHHDY